MFFLMYTYIESNMFLTINNGGNRMKYLLLDRDDTIAPLTIEDLKLIDGL